MVLSYLFIFCKNICGFIIRNPAALSCLPSSNAVSSSSFSEAFCYRRKCTLFPYSFVSLGQDYVVLEKVFPRVNSISRFCFVWKLSPFVFAELNLSVDSRKHILKLAANRYDGSNNYV